MDTNYKELEAKTATRLKIITGGWQQAVIIRRCKGCGKYIYPPRFIWIDADGTFCYACGSKRQDDLRGRIRQAVKA